MRCATLKREFACSNLGFDCNAEERKSFCVSQWCDNRFAFFLYRLAMALNSLGWTIGHYVFCRIHCPRQLEHSYRYMTLWADFLRTLYFVCAAVLVLTGLRSERPRIEGGFVKWVRTSTWLLHGVVMTSNAAVALLYWPFVAPNIDPEVAYNVINVYLHAVNYLLMVVDLLVAAFPVRILHVVYSTALALLYGCFTLLLWLVGDTHAVYSILNWEKSPGAVVAFFLSTAFVAAPLVHLQTYGLHILRKYCHGKLKKQIREQNGNSEHFSLKDECQDC